MCPLPVGQASGRAQHMRGKDKHFAPSRCLPFLFFNPNRPTEGQAVFIPSPCSQATAFAADVAGHACGSTPAPVRKRTCAPSVADLRPAAGTGVLPAAAPQLRRRGGGHGKSFSLFPKIPFAVSTNMPKLHAVLRGREAKHRAQSVAQAVPRVVVFCPGL